MEAGQDGMDKSYRKPRGRRHSLGNLPQNISQIRQQARRGSMELASTVKAIHTQMSNGFEDEVRRPTESHTGSRMPENKIDDEHVVVYGTCTSEGDANKEFFGSDKFVVVDGLVTLACEEPISRSRVQRRGSITDRLIQNISKA
eukprot:CAMPEP_0197436724 /NCGR_PEP_ID=MMETSP1175-20131217/4148_1 /TAXON_ID=1003142 /ORGANISM="Triceratium dubium, Strain CCMP147" /LENGTH=143 /DNA_ID=CAMNT_0042966097 /DNA_START=80 /DNA_END=511 /DNA_ORIENTATION=+